MERRKLGEQEVKSKLSELKNWKAENDILSKKFVFENFAQSLEFVNQIGAIAEKHDHHPDIYFGWGYAEINLTTHDAGGLTQKDFQLAQAINEIQERAVNSDD